MNILLERNSPTPIYIQIRNYLICLIQSDKIACGQKLPSIRELSTNIGVNKLVGADSWVAIETYAQAKHKWLQQFLELPNGIPSHDTTARVFARLNPEAFEQCFHRWVESITETISAQVIPIDGKTIRQSFDRDRLQKAIHVVTAFAAVMRYSSSN
ncbi:MAG: ISAs1 family transposase [Nostoc indistinguendum CM1-VF10]|jgi:DNA-binding transcriptional MocR family regulator|nr:ISAs1 family transposase [Nostoc indistinguendum CM1-VF10]